MDFFKLNQLPNFKNFKIMNFSLIKLNARSSKLKDLQTEIKRENQMRFGCYPRWGAKKPSHLPAYERQLTSSITIEYLLSVLKPEEFQKLMQRYDDQQKNIKRLPTQGKLF